MSMINEILIGLLGLVVGGVVAIVGMLVLPLFLPKEMVALSFAVAVIIAGLLGIGTMRLAKMLLVDHTRSANHRDNGENSNH